jgi:hypothetical protein
MYNLMGNCINNVDAVQDLAATEDNMVVLNNVVDVNNDHLDVNEILINNSNANDDVLSEPKTTDANNNHNDDVLIPRTDDNDNQTESSVEGDDAGAFALYKFVGFFEHNNNCYNKTIKVHGAIEGNNMIENNNNIDNFNSIENSDENEIENVMKICKRNYKMPE